MPTIVPEIIPAPAPAAAPIQESRPACVPRQVEDVTPFRAPSRAPRRVANNPLPATSAQVPVRPEAVRADCSHSFSREDSTNCASPVARAGALAQPAPSSIAPRAAASRLCRHTASMHVTSEVGGGHHHRFSWLPQGGLALPRRPVLVYPRAGAAGDKLWTSAPALANRPSPAKGQRSA